MSEDQFIKLFRYMERRFDTIEAKLETKADKSQIDDILSMIDGVTQRQETEEVERLAMISQLDRQETRLDRVEGQLKSQGAQLRQLGTRLDRQEAQIGNIDARLAGAGI